MGRTWSVVGDPTSSGGTVSNGSPFTDIDARLRESATRPRVRSTRAHPPSKNCGPGDKGAPEWEAPTPEQASSIATIFAILQATVHWAMPMFTNMTSPPTRLPVKGPACGVDRMLTEKSWRHCMGRTTSISLAMAALLLAACRSEVSVPATPLSARIVDVAPSRYHGTAGHPLEEACRNWQLSPPQILAFFRMADSYQEMPYSRFHQVGCSIDGHLDAEGRRWRFAINGGGIAAWEEGGTTRYFGCSAEECAALLPLPSDWMQPD